MQYSLNNWEALPPFLTDPRLPAPSAVEGPVPSTVEGPVPTRLLRYLDPPSSRVPRAGRRTSRGGDENGEHWFSFVEGPFDKNGAENSLRTIALGCKNYLFYYDEETGQKQAVIYVLVASCQANGVNPELYLADVLRRIDRTPDEDLDALLPHRWAASRAQT